METMLVVTWLVSGTVMVPMPDWATCQEAVAQAMEFDAVQASCAEKPSLGLLQRLVQPTVRGDYIKRYFLLPD